MQCHQGPYHLYYSYSVSSQPSPITVTTSSPPPPPPPPHVDFPTSPQSGAAAQDEVTIHHFIHPNHPLAQITVPADLYVCAGCKEYGAGTRFTCHVCNFQLHDFCALSPPLLRGHALHPQHHLVFHSRPKQAGISWPKCDVCGKSVKGFTFRCRACNFHMHPCCAMLPTEIAFPPIQEPLQGGTHRHSMKLLPHQGGVSNSCGECKKKTTGGRMYRCMACSYQLHAQCAKVIINGLRAQGMSAPPEKPKFMGTAARLASQVVVEFIGGIIEGLGEGVGQALLQDIGRGRRRRRLHTTTTTTT